MEHVEPVGQRRVELAAQVLHCVHHHRALGAPLQQPVSCLEAVLEVPVILDDHVVLKSPAIYKTKAKQWVPQAWHTLPADSVPLTLKRESQREEPLAMIWPSFLQGPTQIMPLFYYKIISMSFCNITISHSSTPCDILGKIFKLKL